MKRLPLVLLLAVLAALVLFVFPATALAGGQQSNTTILGNVIVYQSEPEWDEQYQHDCVHQHRFSFVALDGRNDSGTLVYREAILDAHSGRVYSASYWTWPVTAVYALPALGEGWWQFDAPDSAWGPGPLHYAGGKYAVYDGGRSGTDGFKYYTTYHAYPEPYIYIPVYIFGGNILIR